MIRVLPIGHPAHALDLDTTVRDEHGKPTTLAVLEARATACPTFANVRYLLDAIATLAVTEGNPPV